MDLQELVWWHGLDCSDKEEVQIAGACESGNESSGSIKCGVILD